MTLAVLLPVAFAVFAGALSAQAGPEFLGFAAFPFASAAIFFTGVIHTVLQLAVIAYGVYGAVQGFQGRPFRYVLVGRLADGMVSRPAMPDANDETGCNR